CLPHLRTLDLSNCPDAVAPDTLAQLARGCPRLHTLKLYGSSQITDQGIADLVARCTGLRRLDLSACDLLSHSALAAIADHLPELRRLDPMDPRLETARRWAGECDGGNARSCWLLGRAWEQGEAMDADEGSARRLYRRACREGGQGCADAARLHPDQAKAYAEQGCRAGFGRDCARWAELDPEAADAKRLGCAAGWLEGCEEEVEGCGGPLGRCVEQARALAESRPEEARRFARVACSDARTAGCAVYAELLESQDREAAKVAWRWACEGGDAAACEVLLERFDPTPGERARLEALASALRPR
ncbi:MAG TPA: hypothetical protein RMH80_27740, partial [Polyangiaceae bacterium LLY-WYZ-15_(1-7)]|nr:hypothetical protein [Polyangiaceae bacterium LLY-WYZ-15_(1-7)]